MGQVSFPAGIILQMLIQLQMRHSCMHCSLRCFVLMLLSPIAFLVMVCRMHWLLCYHTCFLLVPVVFRMLCRTHVARSYTLRVVLCCVTVQMNMVLRVHPSCYTIGLAGCNVAACLPYANFTHSGMEKEKLSHIAHCVTHNAMFCYLTCLSHVRRCCK